MIRAMKFGQRRRGLAPRDWLLTETVRRVEENDGGPSLDDAATAAAARTPGDPTGRLVERARRLEYGPDAQAAVGRVVGAARWLVLAIIALGLMLGAGAAASMRADDSTLALSYALFVLLGLPTLLLLLWAGLTLLVSRRNASPGIPGRIAWRALASLPHVGGPSPIRPALAGAVTELGRRRAHPLAATATHSFWSAFHLGAMAWLMVLFLGLRFDFTWETTILSGDWLAAAIAALGALPALLPGVEQPGADQIRAVLEQRSGAGDRRLWAGFLVGCLLLYGLVPRLLLALVYAWRWRRTRLPLDLSRPGYLRLLPVLSAPSEGGEAVGPPAPEPDRPSAPRARGGSGAPVLVGIELDDDDWPPSETDCRVLGRGDDRQQRRELLRALARLDPAPSRIVALCSLARTPDRGTGRFLVEMAGFAPVELRLTGAPPAADGDDRMSDWARLAERFELPTPSRWVSELPG
jgi:hypothetical protein